MAAAAANVRYVDSSRQPVDKARDERERGTEKRRVEHGRTLFGHELLKPREPGVGHSTALSKRVHNFRFHFTEHRYELGQSGHVVGPGSARQHCRVFGWEVVTLGGCVVDDDPPRCERTQPFAHVPLVQPGRIGDLGACGRTKVGHGIQQTGAMADAEHEGERAAIEDTHHLAAEGLHLGYVEFGCGQLNTPDCDVGY